MKGISALILVCFYLLLGCNTENENLRNGDILLVSSTENGLSKAINDVTQTEKKTNYSHIALLEVKNHAFWVIHAGTKNGSERIPLDSFLLNTGKNNESVDVYRLKEAYQHAIPNAIKTAKTWLGKPYNYSYVLSDEKLYCSDLIQRSFAKDNLFQLYPMTFIDPETGVISSFWKTFYKDQGIEVPEGMPGCNPNQFAESDKLVLIKRIEN